MKLISTAFMALLLSACSNSSFTSAPECYLNETDNGGELVCNDKKIEIKNGSDGVDGSDGANGIDGADGSDGLFVDIIDPCGQETQFDEVILVTRDGTFLAYFAGNSTTSSRLTVLDEGIMYNTTDGTNCRFKIENGVLID